MPSEPKDNTASHVLHRRTGVLPYTVLSGEGIYLNLNSGRRIIDGSGGAAVACLGHGRKDIADAIQRQLSSFAYAYSGANLTSHPAEELARLLLEDTYGEGSKAFFCNSGSEATEAALKLALQFWREKGCETRTQIVARRQGYHGNTLSALSVSGIDDRRKDYSSWMSPHVTFVERCFPYRGKATSESDQDYVRRLVEDLDNTFQRIGPQNIAAFIMETVSGTSLGCVPPPRGYLKEIAAVCKKHGIILILDEVRTFVGSRSSLFPSMIDTIQIMCGMGRIGALHAWQLEDFDGPDIQTIGKSLGGGFIPLSAVLVSRKVIEAVSLGSGRFSHSHTFQVSGSRLTVHNPTAKRYELKGPSAGMCCSSCRTGSSGIRKSD